MKIKTLLENRSPSKEELLDNFYDRVRGMDPSTLVSLAKKMQEHAWFPQDVHVDKLNTRLLPDDIIEYAGMISDPKQQFDFFDEIVHPVLGTDETLPPG